LLELAREYVGGIEAVAGEVFLERFGDAARSIDQPLACGIVAGPGDERAHRRLRLHTARPLARRYPSRGHWGLACHDVVHGSCRLRWSVVYIAGALGRQCAFSARDIEILPLPRDIGSS